MSEIEDAESDFRSRMSYGDYLRLPELLGAQSPLTDAHDELLFIIQHQTSELWMKLAIREIRAACVLLRADDVQPVFKLLARVARIFEQLNSAWDVLRTMTPSDYSEFRDRLGQSSGFQSWQYRAIEFLAGNRNLAMLRPHDHHPEIIAELTAIIAEPSLYQEAILLLSRRGLDVGEAAPQSCGRRAARRMRCSDKRLGRGLQRSGPSLGPLRARGKADRLRGLSPTLAFQPRHDGRAHHRSQAGHRRHVGRRLPQAHAGDRTLSGALAGADADVSAIPVTIAVTC